MPMKKHRRYRTTYTSSGTIVSRRIGGGRLNQSEIYNKLVTMSWPLFFVWIAIGYFCMALLFAIFYGFSDVENMRGLTSHAAVDQFMELFLYSAQTLSTIGGAGIVPVGLFNNVIFTAESIIALLAAAMITGLLYARFSRPSARMIYSKNALIAPFKNGKALMIRLGNARKDELVEVAAQVHFVKYEEFTTRRTHIELPLERQKIPFLPLTWTIVHPIDEKSPFFNMSEASLNEREFDIMVTTIGLDRATGQNVFSAYGYKDLDLIVNAKFLPCSEVDDQGTTLVHLDRIGDFEKLESEVI